MRAEDASLTSSSEHSSDYGYSKLAAPRAADTALSLRASPFAGHRSRARAAPGDSAAATLSIISTCIARSSRPAARSALAKAAVRRGVDQARRDHANAGLREGDVRAEHGRACRVAPRSRTRAIPIPRTERRRARRRVKAGHGAQRRHEVAVVPRRARARRAVARFHERQHGDRVRVDGYPPGQHDDGFAPAEEATMPARGSGAR